MVTRFGRTDKLTFDPLTELGGSLLHSQAIDPAALEHIPAEANVIAQRKTASLFGAGLIEAIPDQDIGQGGEPAGVGAFDDHALP